MQPAALDIKKLWLDISITSLVIFPLASSFYHVKYFCEEYFYKLQLHANLSFHFLEPCCLEA